MQGFLIAIGVALCYLPFHLLLFAGFQNQLGGKPVKRIWLGLTYVLNYGVFFLCSMLEFYLVVNWLIFAVVLVGEISVLFRKSVLSSLFLGIGGAVVGLSANVFTRCVTGMLLDRPLQVFDAREYEGIANVKRYPIAAGFLLAALLIWVLLRTARKRKSAAIHKDPSSLRFITGLTGAIFAYLMLNLLIFSTPTNDFIIKLWGIKNALCALTSFFIGLRYAAEESRLHDYRLRSDSVREELVVRRVQEAALEKSAYVDELTGCYNREYAVRLLDGLTCKPEPFLLCFADLDGLKAVNDRLGHAYGDRYITAAAHLFSEVLEDERDTLCRYGGDEFLLFLFEWNQEDAHDQIKATAQALQDSSYSSECPFAMSASYGIVAYEKGKSAGELLQEADQRMYESKRERPHRGFESKGE